MNSNDLSNEFFGQKKARMSKGPLVATIIREQQQELRVGRKSLALRREKRRMHLSGRLRDSGKQENMAMAKKQ